MPKLKKFYDEHTVAVKFAGLGLAFAVLATLYVINANTIKDHKQVMDLTPEEWTEIVNHAKAMDAVVSEARYKHALLIPNPKAKF